ncbi:MAG: sulfocyanin-like copper-binding protein, partial [Gemmatimonadaceae bacterium]
GTLVTAGDLVFMGDPAGYLHAYDARTGRELWSYFCGAGVDAPPISFSLDGRQYIAVAAGGSRYGDLKGNAVLLFALGESLGSSAPASPPSAPSAARNASKTDAYAEFATLPGTRVGEFLSYDSASKIVHLRVTGGLRGAHGGMSFNGAHDGGATITLPVGWSVRARFGNADKVPHSMLVIREVAPLPAAPDTPAITGAASSRVASGITSRDAPDEVSFTAREAGRYLLVCGVPGHSVSGMWIRVTVDPSATRPTYK